MARTCTSHRTGKDPKASVKLRVRWVKGRQDTENELGNQSQKRFGRYRHDLERDENYSRR